MFPKLSLLSPCLMLVSCATTRQNDPAMFAYWNCSAAATIDNGNVSVVRWLGPSGELSSTVVMWTPKLPEDTGLHVTGRWEAHPPAAIDFERGLVMFDQSFGGPRRRERSQRLSISLRVRPDGPWDGHGRIEGTFPLDNGVRLNADWADVEAMARGADRLFLIVADRRGTTVSKQALQGAQFIGFRATAERMLDETAAMAREFTTRCQSNIAQDVVN